MLLYNSDIDELIGRLGDSSRGKFYKNLLRMHIILTATDVGFTLDDNVKCWNIDKSDTFIPYMGLKDFSYYHRAIQIQHEYESRTQKFNQQTIMNYAYLVEYLVINNIILDSITLSQLHSAYIILDTTINLFGNIDDSTYITITELTH